MWKSKILFGIAVSICTGSIWAGVDVLGVESIPVGVGIIVGGVVFSALLGLWGFRQRKQETQEKQLGINKPLSRKQNCDKLSAMYLEYYHQFENLIDEISKSSLEDYKKFLKDNEMLIGYKGRSKSKLTKSIEDTFIDQSLKQFKHPMLENRKTDKMKSLAADILKLASAINPDLHENMTRAIVRLDVFGFSVLLGRFQVKYPDPQWDAELSKWGVSRGSHLLELEALLHDESTKILRIINKYKSWWGWLYG